MLTAPLDLLDEEQFLALGTIVTWLTCVYAGLGSEILLGLKVLRAFSIENVHWVWLVSQLIFPLFLMVALYSNSEFGLPVLVVGLWKCGMPETISALSIGLQLCSRARGGLATMPPVERFAYLLDGVGLLTHHTSAVWVVSCLVTHYGGSLDRHILSCTLPLVVQHWFSLLRYESLTNTFLALTLCAEALWQWEVCCTRSARGRGFDDALFVLAGLAWCPR